MAILGNDAVEPRAIDALELPGTDGIADARDLGGGQRDQVGIAVHEADPAVIRDDLDDVAAEQRAPAVRALRPVQDGPAGEVAAEMDERHALFERARLA